MQSIPTRTSMVLAALAVALTSVSVSPLLAQRRDDKDKKPADGVTVAQRQEVAPLARLLDGEGR